MATRKNRGSVGVETKAGKLRLRLPRTIAIDSSRYISTGLDDTPDNLKKVQRLAWEIEEDIQAGLFDVSLEKYKCLINRSNKPSGVIPTQIDLLTLWEKYCEYMKPQLAVTTYQKDYRGKYLNHIKSLPTKDPRQAIAIRDYLLANKSVDTTKRVLMYLSACCSWAVKSGLLTANLFDGVKANVKARKKKVEVEPFTLEEREAIIAAFTAHKYHKHYTSFVRFLFLTGCRTGEAIALQWKHIAHDLSYVTFCESYDTRLGIRKDTKTGTNRKFPCNAVLKQLLNDIRPKYYKPEDLVFKSPTGKTIDANKFTNQVWRGCRSGDKTYRGVVCTLVKEGKVRSYRPPYNTRHTFITMALEAGVSAAQIAKWVGNSPEVIMRHYAGCSIESEVPVM
ncbi:hypothetical protein AMR41_30700 [Hapalosiphon sp. MRB220]|nr:hypothetical protein AMR41_30700 [Hapalosiphon sp. MRB220]